MTTTHEVQLADRIAIDGKRVIDVGCGAGGLVRWLRGQGADVVGVECGVEMRRRAIEADPDHVDAYIDAGGQDLPFSDAEADVIIYSYSMHHVPHDAMVPAIREAHRVLRPGGMLYVLEPVAAGDGHEVDKLVDDETVVRAWAQEALLEAPAIGFDVIEVADYTTQHVYIDVADYENQMVGIDPGRAEAMAAVRDQVHERFCSLATHTDAGFSFDQPNKLVVFTKIDQGAEETT